MVDEAMGLTFEVRESGAVLRVAGQVDITGTHVLQAALIAAIEHQPRVTVDLAGVRFLDSSGVGALVDAWHVWQRAESGHFVLTGPFEPLVERVLDITGVTKAITTVRDGDARSNEESSG